MSDNNVTQGRWLELKDKVKQRWSRLSDDDLKLAEGNLEDFYGKVQKIYGTTREEIEEELEKIAS